jgi:hypothetical protein
MQSGAIRDLFHAEERLKADRPGGLFEELAGLGDRKGIVTDV